VQVVASIHRDGLAREEFTGGGSQVEERADEVFRDLDALDAPTLDRPHPSVDMTSSVKDFFRESLDCPFSFFICRPSEEREPVIATVDPADIRGLGTT
jgi:hypothetical protein